MTAEFMMKMWHVYTVECYSVQRKPKITTFVGTWMEQQSIIMS